MGWDFRDGGFRVIVSQQVPEVVQGLVPDVVESFSDLVEPAKLDSFILHPGGAKILRMIAEALNKPKEAFADSYEVLARFGNMSSPTVLFVLARTVERRRPAESGYSLLAAFGPGFTAEASLLRWRNQNGRDAATDARSG